MSNTILEFRSSDIVLAACLKLNNFVMVSIERTGNKGTFIFENVEKQFIEDFDLGKICVEPVAFNNAIKQLTTSVRRMS